MLKYVQNKDIDRGKWDACIRKSINEIIYAYSWYLDIVCKEWDAIIEDDYISLFPLPYKSKFGIKYIYQPYFAQQLGLFSLKTIGEEKTKEFINAIPDDFKHISICLNTYNNVKIQGCIIEDMLTYQLDLVNNYNDIYYSFSKNTKRNIKKSENNNLKIDKHNPDTQDIIQIFRHNKGVEIKKWGEPQYDTLKKLLNIFVRKNIIMVYKAYNEKNSIIAGAIFVFTMQKVIFLFSGNTNEGKEKGAMFAIINQFIKDNASSNITFDFEGSNEPSLARFYGGFGAKKTIYKRIEKSRFTVLGNYIFKLYKIFRNN